MNRTPKQGEPYQVCTHLAAATDRTDRHYWQVAGRDPWIVMCDECHASFSERRGVEVFGETFTLPADVPIVPGSSCVHHSAPGDVVADDSPPPPPPPKAPKSGPGQLLSFRPKDKDPAWLPIAARVANVAVDLMRSFQDQAQARAKVELRRLQLETQAMERLIQALTASADTIDRLQSLATQREAALVATLDRVMGLVAPLSQRDPAPSNGTKPAPRLV